MRFLHLNIYDKIIYFILFLNGENLILIILDKV